MAILIADFDNEIQELQTLPRASVEIDGLLFMARVFPQDYPDNFKNIAAVYGEQSPAAQAYLDGVFDMQQAHYDSNTPPGLIMQVERRYILRGLPEWRLTYA